MDGEKHERLDKIKIVSSKGQSDKRFQWESLYSLQEANEKVKNFTVFQTILFYSIECKQIDKILHLTEVTVHFQNIFECTMEIPYYIPNINQLKLISKPQF